MVSLACLAPIDASAARPEPLQVRLVRAFPRLAFERPTDVQRARGLPGRLFVVEQAGRIRTFLAAEAIAEAPVLLDLRDRVAAGGEMGLLGLAFHPRFAENGYLYVNYTADAPRRTVVSRFRASAGDPPRVSAASEQVLLSFAQPYANHNGGALAFGPDGLLYVATGDGGSSNDPHNHAQRLDTLLGKVLRLDPDRPGPGRAYGVPPDNPFVGRPDARSEVWAYGLRKWPSTPSRGRCGPATWARTATRRSIASCAAATTAGG
jgi:glucose/arabinose dehydrogenase